MMASSTSEPPSSAQMAGNNNASGPFTIRPITPDTGPAPYIYGAITCVGLALNLSVLLYILLKRTWKNFVSSHFIAHLMCVNIFALVFLVAVFIYDVRTDVDPWGSSHELKAYPVFPCRIQAFLTCAIWAVSNFMATCVAGVHLLTFARIHYDQLFGLSPTIICVVAWVIGMALGLPCLTNKSIVDHDRNFHYCVWGITVGGYKFLAYLVLLGVILPASLTWYAYVRVLGILFHSPVVFEALGLYKSRWLVYFFMISPLYQVPFFVTRFVSGFWGPETYSRWPEVTLFIAYTQCFISPILYGASMFVMKEEDMSIQARQAHKTGAYQPPCVMPQAL